IHPAGDGGMPSRGQVSSARTKASCTASWASSMLPSWRTSTAIALPESRRKASATRAETSSRGAFTGSSLRLERTHLDRAAARCRGLGSAGQCRVEVGQLEDPEAADALLGLRERAVGRDGGALGRVHDGGGRGLLQATGEDVL